MSVASPDLQPGASQRPQWIRATRWHLRASLALMVWAWALVVVVVAVGLVITAQFVELDRSVFTYSHQGLLWFPFALAVIFATTYLPLHVTSGMTRKSLSSSLIITDVATGIANAAFSMIAVLIERAIYHQMGWLHGHTDGKSGDLLGGGIAIYAVGLVLLYVGAMLGGTLVGLTFYRFSGWATFLLPLTLLPVLGTSILALHAPDQWTPWNVDLLGPWTGSLLIGVPILVAACVAIAAIARRIPIATKEG